MIKLEQKDIKVVHGWSSDLVEVNVLREILQDHENNCAQKYADNCRICDFIKARFAVLFKDSDGVR